MNSFPARSKLCDECGKEMVHNGTLFCWSIQGNWIFCTKECLDKWWEVPENAKRLKAWAKEANEAIKRMTEGSLKFEG